MRLKQRTFKEILAQTPAFEKILTKSEEMQYLTRCLHRFLPPHLATHCKVANIKAGCLVVATDKAVWVHQLQYLCTELLARFQQERGLAGIKMIRFMVSPDYFNDTPVPRRKILLSNSNAALLNATAETVSDPTLASALRRLATRVNS